MRFSQISEEDANAQASGLWPNGTYDYEVYEAEEKTSNAGNEMMVLKIWIFNDSGNRTMIFDNLVSHQSFLWKIRHFAASCGLLAQYNKGNMIPSEVVGRTGRCIIETQPENKAKRWKPRNSVADYVKLEGGKSPAPRSVKTGDLDGDDIPF